jgi:hypothetical protein
MSNYTAEVNGIFMLLLWAEDLGVFAAANLAMQHELPLARSGARGAAEVY